MPTLQPGSTSQYFDVDIGQTVSVTPGSGGSMLVEYTTNDEAAIRNGSAVWQAWTAGTVSSATSDVAMFPMYARATAYTAAGEYQVSGSGLRAVPNQFLAWKSDVVSARDPASAAAVVGVGQNVRVLSAFGAIRGEGIQSDAVAAANDAALDAAMLDLRNASAQGGGIIILDGPYFFKSAHTTNRPIILQGVGETQCATFVPTVSNAIFMTWNGVTAPYITVSNEEGQLPNCGFVNLTAKSDRSVRANAFKFVKCDRGVADGFVQGFKGFSLNMQRSREFVRGSFSTRYNGYFDSANIANCVSDVIIGSTDGSGDTSNLNQFLALSLVFPFWHCLELENADRNYFATYLLHQFSRGNSSLETNFCAAFGGTPGWDASGVPGNEFAALHETPAVLPAASVSGARWKRAFAESMALKQHNASAENKFGIGRVIGGTTLATLSVTGSSGLGIGGAEINSAAPFIGAFSADAGTDTCTIGSVSAGSTCDVLPATGTPVRVTTNGTLPAPLTNGIVYYLIRVTDGAFKLATTYARAIAGTALDLTAAGSGTHTLTAGGHPLLVTDGSTVALDEQTYIDNGRIAWWADDTSAIYGLPRIGPTWNQGGQAPQVAGEQMLFRLRNADMNSTGDQVFTRLFAGVRYKITRIIAVLRNPVNAGAAVGGIYTAAAKGGTALVANTQTYTPLATQYTSRTLTLTTAANDQVLADGTFSGSNLYLSLTTADGVGGIADFYIFGIVCDQ